MCTVIGPAVCGGAIHSVILRLTGISQCWTTLTSSWPAPIHIEPCWKEERAAELLTKWQYLLTWNTHKHLGLEGGRQGDRGKSLPPERGKSPGSFCSGPGPLFPSQGLYCARWAGAGSVCLERQEADEVLIGRGCPHCCSPERVSLLAVRACKKGRIYKHLGRGDPQTLQHRLDTCAVCWRGALL